MKLKKSRNTQKGNAFIFFVIIMLISAFTGYYFYARSQENVLDEVRVEGMFWPKSKIMTPFKLTDQFGKEFNLDNLEGKWSFLFFGYTHCPDICPGTLHTMKQTLKNIKELEQDNSDIQIVFVSVDPQRDTQSHLKEYLEYFDPSFIGLTDTEPYLQSLTNQLGVFYLKHKPDAEGKYEVDHTAAILLIGPKKRLIGLFGAPHDAKDMAQRFIQMRTIVEQEG